MVNKRYPSPGHRGGGCGAAEKGRTLDTMRWLLTALLTALFFASAHAGEQGGGAQDLGHLQRLAAGGDAQAQFALARTYHRGRGVTQDVAAAARWYRAAAEQGAAAAQYRLGQLFAFGDGVAQDYAAAARWYLAAARQGHADAQNDLGDLYALGHGVPRDDSAATKWWRAAAQQGHVVAQDSLGLHYAAGVGVPQDLVRAYMWLDLAALRGHEFSRSGRDAAAARMTPGQIGQAKSLVYRWLKAHPR